jgi:hypothetical protein
MHEALMVRTAEKGFFTETHLRREREGNLELKSADVHGISLRSAG